MPGFVESDHVGFYDPRAANVRLRRIPVPKFDKASFSDGLAEDLGAHRAMSGKVM